MEIKKEKKYKYQYNKMVGVVKIQLLIVFCFLELINIPALAATGFFDQRNRGWIWFEEKERAELAEQEQNKPQQAEPSEAEYAKAREEVEQFAADLEKLKFMMLRYPNNLEHIGRYKEKEAIMLQNALLLSGNYSMVNFLNPELADELAAPANLYGRTIKKQVDVAEQKQQIKAVAKKVELFFFSSASCPYCQVMAKHLNVFAQEYGFVVTAVSPDGSRSEYFQTHHAPEIIKQLELEVMPTVIAITNDSSVRFELARGAVSIPELEEKALLMVKRMEQLEANFKQEEGMEWQESKNFRK
jgi:thiol-disulfide isomerase/thioredoxin